MNTWAIGLMSNDEKRNILDKHKYLYDGYRTMQPEIKKEQPLFVQDFANDKGGITVTNKGNVKTYTNVGINEQVEESECMECGDKYAMEEEKQVCSECGGNMMEGECMECGWKGEMVEDFEYDDMEDGEELAPSFRDGEFIGMEKPLGDMEDGEDLAPAFRDGEFIGMEEPLGDIDEETQQVKDLRNVEDLNLHDKFDYVEGEMEETEQGFPYDKMDVPYDFKPEGPDVSGDVYTVKAHDMDLDDEEEKPAFDFESEGPMKVYETMVSAFAENGFGKDSFIGSRLNEPKEDETIVLDLGQNDEDDDDFLDDIDEDLRESVINQKNKITEMFNRMKRF